MATRYPDAPLPVDTIEEQINHFFDRMVERMVACANHRRLTLIAKANDKRLEMASRVTQRTRKEEELMATKADVERQIRDNELREFQERILAEIEVKLAEVRLPQPETRLVFRGECEQLEQLMLGLGEVFEEEVPAPIPQYQQMRQVVTVGKKGQAPGELSIPQGVAIDKNTNHIYVAEGIPARVSIFSESGEFMNTFTHEHMGEPYGIAIHANNVYVTDTGVHGVFHYKIEADMRLDAALLGWGSDDGKFNSPGQLAVSANGDVFVADRFNHRVQILDESLYFRHSIRHESMNGPVDVKLTNIEVYVLSYIDSPCIHAFSYAGEKIRSFITRDQGMQVSRAWFFCLDAQLNLIISDGGENSVKVLSPDGTLLHTIRGFQGGLLDNPQGVVQTKQLKLVVIAPCDHFQLQIFSC